MNTNNPAPRATTACSRLRIFSLYLDFPASIRARWANSTISGLAGQSWITSAEMWKMDSLATSDAIRHMITGEAAKADILLIAISSLNYRQSELIEWLGTLAAWRTDRQDTGLLIGLFGGDDSRTSELNWTVKQCQNCSRPMNRDFIWQWMEIGAMGDYSWLRNKLESFLGGRHMTKGVHLPGRQHAVA